MERHISRRQFLGVSAAAIVGAAAAACGATPTATPVPKPPAGATAAPVAPTPAPAQKVKIAFANWWGAQRRPLMDKVIEEFMKVNPNIEVENQEQTWDNRDQLAATIMASSTPPAVVMSTRIETLKYAKQGLIIPITPYVQAAKLDVDKLFYAGEIANQRWNNELWTFPMPTGGGNSCIYWYNKTMLKKAGLDPDKPPKTWQELEEVGKKCQVKKGNAIDILGACTTASGSFTDFVYMLVCNGGHFASEDAKQITINSAEGVDTLEWMVNFENSINGGISAIIDYWKDNNDTSPDGRFYKERTAIWWQNVSAFSHLKTQAPAIYDDPTRWGVALRPYNGKNPKAKSQGETGLAFAWGQVIPKAVPKAQQDAAYKFIEFLSTNEKGVCYFLFQQDRPAPLKSCNDNPEYKKNNPYWDIVMQGLQNDTSSPVTPVQNEISSIMNESIQKAFFGTMKPKAALDEAASKCQPILDKYWSGK